MFAAAATPCPAHTKAGTCAQECNEDKCGSTDEQNCDVCGSFSCCALCSGFLLPEVKQSLQLSLTDIIEKKMFYEFNKEPRKGISSIWQPPKINLNINGQYLVLHNLFLSF